MGAWRWVYKFVKPCHFTVFADRDLIFKKIHLKKNAIVILKEQRMSTILKAKKHGLLIYSDNFPAPGHIWIQTVNGVFSVVLQNNKKKLMTS